jgi:hypothetical protein
LIGPHLLEQQVFGREVGERQARQPLALDVDLGDTRQDGDDPTVRALELKFES